GGVAGITGNGARAAAAEPVGVGHTRADVATEPTVVEVGADIRLAAIGVITIAVDKAGGAGGNGANAAAAPGRPVGDETAMAAGAAVDRMGGGIDARAAAAAPAEPAGGAAGAAVRLIALQVDASRAAGDLPGRAGEDAASLRAAVAGGARRAAGAAIVDIGIQ